MLQTIDRCRIRAWTPDSGVHFSAIHRPAHPLSRIATPTVLMTAATAIASLPFSDVASAAGGVGTAGGPCPPTVTGLPDDCPAWWQFDRWNRFINEADPAGPFLSVSGPAMTVDSPIGTEFALVSGPDATGQYLYTQGSSDGSHWSGVGDGQLTGMVVFTLDDVPGSGHRGLVSRWRTDEEGQWRFGVTPSTGGAGHDAELELHVATDSSEFTLNLDGLDVGRSYCAMFSIDELAGKPTASIHAVDDAGVSVGEATMVLDGPVRDFGNHLEFGGYGFQEALGAPAHIDRIAFWTRILSVPERNELTNVCNDDFASWSRINGASGLTSPVRNPEQLNGIFSGDRRHIIVGDSFVVPDGWGRVFPAILKVHPVEDWTALSCGVRDGSAFVRTTTLVDPLNDNNPRRITATDGYGVEFTGGLTATDYFGFPTHSVEELRAHPGLPIPGDGVLWDMSVRNGGMDDGATGRFTFGGDRLNARVLHRRTSTDARQFPRLTISTPTGATEMDLLIGQNRQVASAVPTHTWDDAMNENPAFSLVESVAGDLAGAERFVDLAGFVLTKVDAAGDRIPGQYYATLCDRSWKTSGWGQDMESSPSSPKRVSRLQFRSWLEATTIDPAQPITMWWYFDAEPGTVDAAEARVQAMLDQANTACVELALPAPNHVLVVPHAHLESSIASRAGVRVLHQRYRDGFVAVADDPAYPNVAVVSIYDATDGVLFDGSVIAESWLAERGYDAFSYGDNTVDLVSSSDLLDNFGSHPEGQDAAAFFASFISAAIIDATCPADLDQGGDVGFSDLVSWLAIYDPSCQRSCGGDLNGDGAESFADLVFLLGQWGPC